MTLKAKIYTAFKYHEAGNFKEAEALESTLPLNELTKAYFDWRMFHNPALDFDAKRKQLFQILDKL